MESNDLHAGVCLSRCHRCGTFNHARVSQSILLRSLVRLRARHRFCNLGFGLCLIIASIALAGCGTPAAKDFRGSWKPVNHFREQPTEIPLAAVYTFYAAPVDETLKAMLTRWASDSGRELSYQLPYDVTLHLPVSSIRTTDLAGAVQQLTTIYAAQHVHVSATDRKILVRPSSTITDVHDQTMPAASASGEMAGSQ